MRRCPDGAGVKLRHIGRSQLRQPQPELTQGDPLRPEASGVRGIANVA